MAAMRRAMRAAALALLVGALPGAARAAEPVYDFDSLLWFWIGASVVCLLLMLASFLVRFDRPKRPLTSAEAGDLIAQIGMANGCFAAGQYEEGLSWEAKAARQRAIISRRMPSIPAWWARKWHSLSAPI